jgi:hypothetical protein
MLTSSPGNCESAELSRGLIAFVISAGQRLWPQIEKQITDPSQSDAWSVFLTQNSLTSEGVFEEIGFAVAKGMVTQAAAAGFYKTEYGQFPKIQIVTVEQLFSPGKPLHLPWQDTSVFKKAKREKTEKQSELDL